MRRYCAVIDFSTALKISRNKDIVDMLLAAAGECEQFKSLEQDCLLAQNEQISVDELVEKISPVIDNFRFNR